VTVGWLPELAASQAGLTQLSLIGLESYACNIALMHYTCGANFTVQGRSIRKALTVKASIGRWDESLTW